MGEQSLMERARVFLSGKPGRVAVAVVPLAVAAGHVDASTLFNANKAYVSNPASGGRFGNASVLALALPSFAGANLYGYTRAATTDNAGADTGLQALPPAHAELTAADMDFFASQTVTFHYEGTVAGGVTAGELFGAGYDFRIQVDGEVIPYLSWTVDLFLSPASDPDLAHSFAALHADQNDSGTGSFAHALDAIGPALSTTMADVVWMADLNVTWEFASAGSDRYIHVDSPTGGPVMTLGVGSVVPAGPVETTVPVPAAVWGGSILLAMLVVRLPPARKSRLVD